VTSAGIENAVKSRFPDKDRPVTVVRQVINEGLSYNREFLHTVNAALASGKLTPEETAIATRMRDRIQGVK
jgi:hypothetical protein